MDELQWRLPYMLELAKAASDSTKEAIEEQRLRRAIEEAERRILGQERSQPARWDVATGKCTGQATKGEKEEQTQKGGRRTRVSGFLEWEEPVLR